MIYIVNAFYGEAKPFIEYYRLKRNGTYKNFQVFENEEMKLVVSGIGKINAAIATSYILSQAQLNCDDIILNIGICGSKKRKIGECVLINKIIDVDNKRNLYPDILLKHEFQEGTIETFSNIVVDSNIGDTCDMEASGFFQAATKFVGPHQVHIIKIVSDNLSNKKLEKGFIDKIINNNIEKIIKHVDNLVNCFKKCELLNKFDIHNIQNISLNLNLTENQKIQFRKKYISYIIREGISPELNDFINVRVTVKNESKKQFKKLIEKLSE
ncbi:hypothetical protein ACFIJ5_15795 [Haloimpatiens sp. FM7330]|uniref:5'-methylthioadenosine/S-adenosylhomocysteine nucleosidase family protein n=1 Tax=Haloimpatiens sp. FM7330 TaxID=3298610 RepID=UPI00363F6AFB